MTNRLFFFIVMLVLPTCSIAQPADIANNLKQHITTLASDKYEGRETGTNGEKLAYKYLIKQFKEIGLATAGTDGYLQPFPFTIKRQVGKNNRLVIDGRGLKMNDDFITLPYYFNGEAKGLLVNVGFGISAPKIEYDDYSGIKEDLTGKIFLMEYGSPEGDNPHSKYGEYNDIITKLETAIKKGAAGVILINSNKDVKDPEADLNRRLGREYIPVMFVKGGVAAELKKPGVVVEMKVDLPKVEGTGHNVLGYIDNQAPYTVVFTAHYDHLGYGDDGSLHRGEKAIHNGADDNASGTAALIELARYFKKSDLKKNNYLFFACSGEEKGLLGSNYFVKNPTMPLEKMNYNINMDMLGRLKPEEPVLIINGVGTSPAFNDVIKNITLLKVKTTESGVSPSDNTSFYLNNIPAVHFFSGTHSEYHKPADDEPLINYQGIGEIYNYIIEFVKQLNDKNKLVFSKTNDADNSSTPRFKVTLGVVPDYAYEGEGMRIDGVSDNKPAAKAGLIKGDVVLQIGDEKVSDMTTYMRALSKFTKGQTTKVKVKRGSETLEKEITF